MFHFPKTTQQILNLSYEIIKPVCMIILSFLSYLLPLQAFFPSEANPDIPVIVLFCLLLHRYALYFVPLFLLAVTIYEYSFMIPTGSLLLHYGIFTLIGSMTWQKRLSNDISFGMVYFYFYTTYGITYILDVIIYAIFYKGYLGFSIAFFLWLSTVIIFPAIFYMLYYAILYTKPTIKRTV